MDGFDLSDIVLLWEETLTCDFGGIGLLGFATWDGGPRCLWSLVLDSSVCLAILRLALFSFCPVAFWIGINPAFAGVAEADETSG